MTDECLDEVNERSTSIVTATFRNEDGALVIPDAATVRIDDEKRRTNIRPVTALGSLASAIDIEITSDENHIVRPRSKYEVRTVTVEYDYDGSTKHGTARYQYKLLNLYGVVDVASPSTSPSASASPST